MPQTLTPPVATALPTRARYRVVGLMIALAMVTYLDRACIATLAPNITKDLGLNKDQMAWVFSAFGIAYALFEIPTAWWADRRGTRRVLTRIVLWWSAFTMATAAAFSYASMLAVRFLFGAGEAGAWPCVGRTFARWIPLAQRGWVQGIFFAGAHLAGGLTPFAAAALSGVMGWRGVFVVFGCVGIAWVVVWQLMFRDDPADDPSVNDAERALITAGRGAVTTTHEGWPYWRRLLTHRNTLPLCLAYIPNGCCFYFCISWLPTFLKEKHGFTAGSLYFFSGLPLILAVAGDLSGGALTDFVVRRFGLRIGRAGVAALGNLIAGVAMIAATLVHDPVAAIVLIALAVAATMATLGAQWGTALDIGGSHVAVVGAAMNTTGQFGAIFGPPLVAWLLKLYGDWNVPVFAIGGVCLVGTLCWCFVDPRDKVFE